MICHLLGVPAKDGASLRGWGHEVATTLGPLNEELHVLLRPCCRAQLTDQTARTGGSIPGEMLVFSFPLRSPSLSAGS